MTIPFLIAFAVSVFALTVVAEPLARWSRLPHSALLVLVGAAVAYFVTLGLGIDTGLRAANFHDLIFYVFLPVLIFEAAFKIPQAHLKADLGAILFLAVLGMLLTTVVGAALLYWGIGHPIGFPWMAAFLGGALLAATDPVAVVAQLKALGAPERLSVLLEGESLFNDATAIVLFGMFLTLAAMPAAELDFVAAGKMFLLTFFGGALVGAVVGGVGVALKPLIDSGAGIATLTLGIAYGSFLLAEGVLHVSGVMAALVAGLVCARAFGHNRAEGETLDHFWGALSYVANGCVFLLMGATITVAMFQERWLAMLIAIGAILFARACAIFGGLAMVNPLLRERIPLGYQSAMVWGGLRGAVTLALALSLPVELDYWWTLQSMAFGVVLFTLFVQAPTTPMLLRRLGVAG